MGSQFRSDQPAAALLCLVALAAPFSAAAIPPGVDYVVVPAGGFIMGQSGDDESYQDESPAWQAEVAYDFAISTYEVTNAEYAAFLNSPAVTPADIERYIDVDDPHVRIAYDSLAGQWQAEPGWENHPVVEVSWYGADAYCRWDQVGGRLPTEPEWEKAARWDAALQHSNRWPWGDVFLPGGGSVYYPDDPPCSYWWGNRYWQEPPIRSYPVGIFAAWPSPCGAQDMAGNVWEWTMGGYGSYPSAWAVFHDHSREVQRGGSWTNSDYNCRGATRSPQPRYITDANLGFRVVWSDTEPQVPALTVPPRTSIAEWIEPFDVATPMGQTVTFWSNPGGTASYVIDEAESWLVASIDAAPGGEVGGEFFGMVLRDAGGLFQTGDLVDVSVRLFYERGDRTHARTSVSVSWSGSPIHGARGADENMGYPWYLIANNSDTPGVWHDVTCPRLAWGGDLFSIGFGLWASLPAEAAPPIEDHIRMWVDEVRVRHSRPDYPVFGQVAPPTPGILVRLLDAGGSPLAEAYTDESGDYRVHAPDLAGGTYTVAIHANGLLLESREIEFTEASIREDFRPRTPDLDHDGDVDQSDFGWLQSCLSGTGGYQGQTRCIEAHLDDDADVDADDIAIFLGCRSGPGEPFKQGCFE